MIMKKNFFLCLLMMAFPITFFSACGDDKDKGDEPPKPTTWQDGAGDYKKNGGGVLTINGTEADSTKTVTLAAGSGDNAKIILTNLVPDDATVEFDNVEMKKSGNDYTFSSEKTVGTTTITISGTLSGIPATKATMIMAPALDIKIARKINSPVAGVWKLNFTDKGGDVFFDVSTGDVVKDAIFNKSLAAMLGGMLMQKVSNVTATFSEDGRFDVTWINQGGTEVIGMPPSIKDRVEILYFATEDKVFIALNKMHIPMLGVLAGDINLAPLLASMTDKGDFLALPLNIKVFTGEGIPTGYGFYIEKGMVLTALPLIGSMLGNLGEQMPPEIATAMGPLLNSLPEIVANSEKFNIGLNFTGKDNALK
jgi:hypothetical protein